MVDEIVLTDVVTGGVLRLSTENTFDYILSDKNGVDWGSIESTHHSFKFVNQIGVYVTGTSLETRSIAIIGYVIASNKREMTNRKTVLNRFFNPQHAIDMVYRDYTLRFLPNSSIRYGTTKAENNEVICKFKVEGLCPDPLFAESQETQTAAASTIGGFHFPMILPNPTQEPEYNIFGLRQPSLIVVIENVGAVDVGMKIVFKASGTVENPRLIDVNTQKFFRIEKTMVAGERIEVNTTVGEKYIRGVLNGETSNYFKYRDLDSEWLQLKVGDNLFRYDCDGGQSALEVYIYHQNKYLEVQECC